MSEQSPLDALPICLGCYRRRVGMSEPVPAPPLDARLEVCEVCHGPTNHGLYLLRGTGERGTL